MSKRRLALRFLGLAILALMAIALFSLEHKEPEETWRVSLSGEGFIKFAEEEAPSAPSPLFLNCAKVLPSKEDLQFPITENIPAVIEFSIEWYWYDGEAPTWSCEAQKLVDDLEGMLEEVKAQCNGQTYIHIPFSLRFGDEAAHKGQGDGYMEVLLNIQPPYHAACQKALANL